MEFVDIHGHYAWQIDDGIESMAAAKKALKEAYYQGIREIVATPHITCGKDVDLNLYRQRIDELEVLASKYEIKVYHGSELMLNRHVKETLENQAMIPINNGYYLLCENDLSLSTDEFIEFFDVFIRDVINQGYVPIIAHLERYFNEPIDLEYVKYLIDLGCLIQVNTTSVLGLCHPQHHQNALTLLDKQLVHVLASDTHSYKAPRKPNMLDCYYYLRKKGYLKRYLELLMVENPKRIVSKRVILKPHFKKVKHLMFRLLS